MASKRAILITGATGKQGGALIRHLLASESPSSPLPFELLAVTRDPNSGSAQGLASKSPHVKLVKGDLDHPAQIFAEARKATACWPIWGVFSVQVAIGNKSDEMTQGKNFIDASRAAGIKFLVQTSVDRGGDDKSAGNPTDIPHFVKKHEIELHLRKVAADSRGEMDYAILRPVAFFENLVPGFMGKVFNTCYRDVMGTGAGGSKTPKKLQLISTADIGYFGAQMFLRSDEFRGREMALAGDELTYPEWEKIFKEETGQDLQHTFSFLAALMRWAIPDFGLMFKWFYDVGYGADIKALRQLYPELKDFRAWLREESSWAKKGQ